MPIYAYKCTACEHHYEVREGFDAPARQPCPVCGEPARRVIFPPPIVFKGSGFYATDSRKGDRATIGDNAGADSSKAEGGGSESGDSSKSESSTLSTAPSSASES